MSSTIFGFPSGGQRSPAPKSPPTLEHKTIYFLRHGVAQHNMVADSPEHNAPHLLDASLTHHGLKQAQMTGIKIANYLRNSVSMHTGRNEKTQEKAEGESLPINTILCSPLSRCCETAIAVASTAAETYNSYQQPGRRESRQHQDEAQAPSRQIPEIVCIELLREAYGINVADRRRPKTYLQSKFGRHILFDPSMSEEDDRWTPDTRETLQDVQTRILQFFEWLTREDISKQVGSSILVVSHGVWIECCLRHFCPEALKGDRRVYNCDLFQGKLQLKGNNPSSLNEFSYELTDLHFVSSGNVF